MRDTFALAARLMVFALVAALLLALVNSVTADRIEENTRAKVTAARQEVIGDYAFEDAGADLTGASYITGVYRAVYGAEASSGARRRISRRRSCVSARPCDQ